MSPSSDLSQEPEVAYKRNLPEPANNATFVSFKICRGWRNWQTRQTQDFEIIDFKTFLFVPKTKDHVIVDLKPLFLPKISERKFSDRLIDDLRLCSLLL